MSKLIRIRYFKKYKIFYLFFSHNYINYIKIQKGEKEREINKVLYRKQEAAV